MTKFRTRLLIALITLIIIVLVGLGILLGQLFKSYYLQSFNEHLKKESNLFSIYISDNGGVNSINKKDVLKIANMLDVRATITSTEGEILHESVDMNQSHSSELKTIIDKVIKKKHAKEDIFTEDDGYDLHYFWKPITKEGQRKDIYS